MSKIESHIQNQGVALRNLENQVGQLANALSLRPSDSLPSNTETPKPNGKEHCKAITLRSGNIVETPEVKKKNWKNPTSTQEEEKKEQGQVEKESKEAENSGSNVIVLLQQKVQQHKPPPPFPQHFQKQQHDQQFRRFLDVLK